MTRRAIFAPQSHEIQTIRPIDAAVKLAAATVLQVEGVEVSKLGSGPLGSFWSRDGGGVARGAAGPGRARSCWSISSLDTNDRPADSPRMAVVATALAVMVAAVGIQAA
jgi:hypothetical protein